ncbi:MAG: hypothetical protein IPM56_01455 [Ignavibacteriales bacterium]|nr:MAG: hypothetical protein IPM56_01455 [Ignavibacteriales bacterium]
MSSITANITEKLYNHFYRIIYLILLILLLLSLFGTESRENQKLNYEAPGFQVADRGKN